jgi:hypothetical protein
MSDGELQERQAWRGALVAATLNAVGMPFDLVLARHVPHMPAWPGVASAAVGAAIAALLLLRRRRPTLALARLAFSLNAAAILAALWITSGYWATTARWVPFQAHKLGVLAVAVLAPDTAVGLAGIAAYAGLPLLQTRTFAPEIRRAFPVGEPWTIIAYAIFGVAFLLYRLNGQILARKMLRMGTETAAAERLARTFLAVRDFTNTPLQTIELATEVIRKGHPELEPILGRIDRSVDRLFRLNHTFSAYESHLKWTSADVSLDPEAVIDRHEHPAPP